MINDTSKEFIRRHIGPSEEDIKEMLKLSKVIPRIDKFTQKKTRHFYKFLG